MMILMQKQINKQMRQQINQGGLLEDLELTHKKQVTKKISQYACPVQITRFSECIWCIMMKRDKLLTQPFSQILIIAYIFCTMTLVIVDSISVLCPQPPLNQSPV